MPELQARSSVGAAWEATTHWCLSPSLSPSLPLSQVWKAGSLFVQRKLKFLFPFSALGSSFLFPKSGVQATTPDLQRPESPLKTDVDSVLKLGVTPNDNPGGPWGAGREWEPDCKKNPSARGKASLVRRAVVELPEGGMLPRWCSPRAGSISSWGVWGSALPPDSVGESIILLPHNPFLWGTHPSHPAAFCYNPAQATWFTWD